MNKWILVILSLVLFGCGEDKGSGLKTYQNENPLIESGKWSTLHELISTGDREGVNTLLEKNIDVNIVAAKEDLRQLSPLHLAVQFGDIEIVKSLLAKGANVNQVTTTGMTALHFAIDKRNSILVQLLVKAGADLASESLFVHFPAKYAKEKGFEELIPLLENVSK